MIFTSQAAIHPRRLRLEASTACQLKCPSCPTASGETGKKLGVGFLKFRDFKKLIDENPRLAHIELSNWGEVFLNKDLLQILRYAYEQNVALYLANGANLNNVKEDVLEAVVKYKLRKINCSIDGASQETYSIYRVNGNFDRVIANIKKINEWKAHYHSAYPELKWQFVAFDHNQHEIATAKKMAEEMNMEFRLKLSWGDLYSSEFSPVKQGDIVKQETGLGVSSRKEFEEKYGKDYIEKSCCRDLWVAPQVNYDGRILGCVINYWGDYGNVFREGLKEGLNNERINYARRMLQGKAEARAGIPCTTCKVYASMKRADNWITEEEMRGVYMPGRFYIMLENKFLGKERMRRLAKSLYKIRIHWEKLITELRNWVPQFSG